MSKTTQYNVDLSLMFSLCRPLVHNTIKPSSPPYVFIEMKRAKNTGAKVGVIDKSAPRIPAMKGPKEAAIFTAYLAQLHPMRSLRPSTGQAAKSNVMTKKPKRFEIPLPRQAVEHTANLTGICLGESNVSKNGFTDKIYNFPRHKRQQPGDMLAARTAQIDHVASCADPPFSARNSTFPSARNGSLGPFLTRPDRNFIWLLQAMSG